MVLPCNLKDSIQASKSGKIQDAARAAKKSDVECGTERTKPPKGILINVGSINYEIDH